MRFQQLKKNSNSILRKKMYKSGKSWVVKSTLSFMGGLVLFGVSQSTVVKADDTAGAVSQATAEVSTTQGQNAGGTVAKTDVGVEDDTGKSGNDTTGIQTQNSVSVPQTSQIATKAVVQNQQKGGSEGNDANQPEQSNGSTVQGSDTPVKSSAEVNMATEPDVSGSDSDDTESKIAALGTDWNITDGNTLHILPGTLNDTTYNRSNPDVQSEWSGLDEAQKADITNITIDGKVTAQQSIAGLFANFDALEKIDGLNNIDVTTVTDFSSLFVNDSKLASVDISNWNWINGMDFSSMFAAGTVDKYIPDPKHPDDNSKGTISNGENDALKTIILPKSIINSSAVSSDDRENISFNGMFQNNGNLEYIDISHLDMTGAGDVSGTFANSRNISKITLWSKNDLTGSSLGPKDTVTVDGKEPNGWQSSYKDNLVVLFNDFPLLYNGKSNANIDGLTWSWVHSNYINFNVEYVAADDESKVFGTLSGVSGYANTEYSPDYFDSSANDSNYTVGTSTEGYYTGLLPNIVRLTDDTKTVKVPLPKNTAPTYKIVAVNTKGNVVEGPASYDEPSDIKGIFKDKDMNISETDSEAVVAYVDQLDSNGNLNIGHAPDHFMEFTAGQMKSFIGIPGGGVTETNYKKAGTLMDLLKLQFANDESGSQYTITMIYDVPDKTTDPGSGTTTGGNTSGGNTSSGSSSSSSHHSSSNNSSDNSTDTPEVSHSVESIKETIGTNGDIPDVQLYDDNGNPVTDRTLAPSSDWFTDNLMTLDGVEYYRVATDLWAKAENVYVYHPINSKVLVDKGKLAKLVTSQGKPVTDRELKSNSGWYTDRYTYINNAKYYRVATNEFVSADDVEEY